MRRGGVREHSVRSCRLRWLGRMRRGGVREVAAHTSQAKPLFVRNRQVYHLVTHLPVSSFLNLLLHRPIS